jgi:hypothetical protein
MNEGDLSDFVSVFASLSDNRILHTIDLGGQNMEEDFGVSSSENVFNLNFETKLIAGLFSEQLLLLLVRKENKFQKELLRTENVDTTIRKVIDKTVKILVVERSMHAVQYLEKRFVYLTIFFPVQYAKWWQRFCRYVEELGSEALFHRPECEKWVLVFFFKNAFNKIN